MAQNCHVTIVFFILYTAIVIFADDSESHKDLCPDLVDIALLLDESASIQPHEVEQEKKFAKNLIANFNVGQDAAKFSVLTFARYPRVTFNFKTTAKPSEMDQYITWIKQRGGKTDTYRALQLLRTYTFKPAQGGRSAAKPIGIIITDGQSQLSDRTRIESQKVRDSGVTMIAIGVGDSVRQEELKDIAGDDKYIFRVDSYDQLDELITQLSTSICAVCREKKVDAYILLDNTLDAGQDNYLHQYLTNVIYSFNVSLDLTRLGLVTYGTKVQIISDLDESISRSAVEEKLSTLPDDTNTFPDASVAGLKKVASRMSEIGRRDVAQVVVLVTSGDGLGPDAVQVAQEMRKNGIEVFAAVVDHRPNMETLVNITGTADHVFTAHSSYRLRTTRRSLTEGICKLEVEQSEQPYECRGKAADVVFMMDESSSITWPDYDREKQFLIDTINKFKVQLNVTRVGLVTFSTDAKLRFKLDEYDQAEPVIRKITEMPRKPGNTNTGDALKMARTEIFPAEMGSRRGLKIGGLIIPQVGVVITDGRSQQTRETAKQAKALRDDGVVVIVVAIGASTDQEELESIASEKDFILPVVDFNALHSMVDKLGAKVCKAAGVHAEDRRPVPDDVKPTPESDVFNKGPSRGDTPDER